MGGRNIHRPAKCSYTIITSTNFSKSNTSLSVYFVCFPSPLRFSFTDGFGGTKVILPLTQMTVPFSFSYYDLFLWCFHKSGHLHNCSKTFFRSSIFTMTLQSFTSLVLVLSSNFSFFPEAEDTFTSSNS